MKQDFLAGERITGYQMFDKPKCGASKGKCGCGCSGGEKGAKQRPHTAFKNISAKKTAKVIDAASNEILPFSAIVNLRTKQGVEADENGNFTLTGHNGDIIQVSFVGYKSVKLPLSQINGTISLVADDLLDEVVITAAKKKNPTSSLLAIILGSLYVTGVAVCKFKGQ
ncbi:carboxypeptidase-like regulatory domain-containing protein [Tenacibaculum finnmarkense]|uniref:carboxypeptidase-like regulatory domain-containing protein n=1 Tax=Tenacibaculum finnmarkense TaxID=2781243 RepID=UPI001E62D38C|nr:carboxypeptidase-like regulatory domain-containing protein [Tenacibaculum finnmarkense]MCD8403622.1 carboxypeptidase-like regulatory domain-containing protein [Tenacibaculum finnmarkense genomovar finnmarkense]MCG8239603.1 carboxypeptidase-like regulatory domain-containing protein [Tenacibaculum finnmarkense genomovar ulcerans]